MWLAVCHRGPVIKTTKLVTFIIEGITVLLANPTLVSASQSSKWVIKKPRNACCLLWGHLGSYQGKIILIFKSRSVLETFPFLLGSDKTGALLSWLMAFILTSAKPLSNVVFIVFSVRVHMYVFEFSYFPLGYWTKKRWSRDVQGKSVTFFVSKSPDTRQFAIYVLQEQNTL